MAGGILRILLYFLIITGPALALSLTSRTYYGIVAETGRSAALAGFMILLLQPVLAGRYRWVTRPFGFDIVIRFHRHMAVLALLLLIAHPVMLGLGAAGLEILYSFDQPLYILPGRAALLVLVLIAAFSLSSLPDRMGFERWRIVHDVLTPAVIVIGLVHALAAGEDLVIPWLRWSVITAAALSLVAYAYHRFVRPALLSRRPYSVAGVERIADKVWDIRLTPPGGGEAFDHLPGQFHFMTFHRREGLPEEEHHFTISSSPADRSSISSTIKELGDFTSTIGETRPGDTATVHGPFGRFSYLLHPSGKDLVFIAGGIGVTPLMAMIRHMRDTGSQLPVLLIYSNRDPASIAFREELDSIAREGSPKLRVVHVLKDPGEEMQVEAGATEKGRLDPEMLERLCEGRFVGRSFYVCGPPGLLEMALRALRGRGVPDRSIHAEIFRFID